MRVEMLEEGSVRFDESGVRLRREENPRGRSRRRRIWMRRYAGGIVARSRRLQRCLLPVALYESPRLSDFDTMYALHSRTSGFGKRHLSHKYVS